MTTLPVNTKPPTETGPYLGDNISVEMSHWLARIAQTCDAGERADLAEAAKDISERGSEENPIQSIYDERVPEKAHDFVLRLATRLS